MSSHPPWSGEKEKRSRACNRAPDERPRDESGTSAEEVAPAEEPDEPLDEPDWTIMCDAHAILRERKREE